MNSLFCLPCVCCFCFIKLFLSQPLCYLAFTFLILFPITPQRKLSEWLGLNHNRDVLWDGVSLWLLGIICLLVSLPNLLHTLPVYSLGGQSEKGGLSATIKLLVCCQYCFDHTYKIQHPNSCYEETYLHPS